MRFIFALSAALLVAGFTVQDAEKALDGEWAGRAVDVSVAIDVAAKTGRVTDAGKISNGAFSVVEVSGRAVTARIGSELFVFHVRHDAKTLGFAPMGKGGTFTLVRVP